VPKRSPASSAIRPAYGYAPFAALKMTSVVGGANGYGTVFETAMTDGSTPFPGYNQRV
jgi:hypothetical protein